MGTAKRDALQRLQLLCSSGMDPIVIAPSLCRLVRDHVGTAAAALFWLDENGLPQGFHHEDSPDHARDLFVNEFERLFVGPQELNVLALAKMKGSRIGHVARPDSTYFKSNTFNLLVRASGHHHCLDLRVDVDGKARIVVLLFRPEISPFEPGDAVKLEQVAAPLREALTRAADQKQWALGARQGHLLVDHLGQNILLIDAEAEALLKQCTLVGQNVSLLGPLRTTPRFVQDLCASARNGRTTGSSLSVPSGRLRLTASRMARPGTGPRDDAPIMVQMAFDQPEILDIVERIMALKLSPRQREIALVAALGGSRQDGLKTTATSNEALKKHLAAIYQATGVSTWDRLAATLGGR